MPIYYRVTGQIANLRYSSSRSRTCGIDQNIIFSNKPLYWNLFPCEIMKA